MGLYASLRDYLTLLRHVLQIQGVPIRPAYRHQDFGAKIQI